MHSGRLAAAMFANLLLCITGMHSGRLVAPMFANLLLCITGMHCGRLVAAMSANRLLYINGSVQLTSGCAARRDGTTGHFCIRAKLRR
jgi:hypothetical protein